MRMYAMCAACGRAIAASGRLCSVCRRAEIQRRRVWVQRPPGWRR